MVGVGACSVGRVSDDGGRWPTEDSGSGASLSPWWLLAAGTVVVLVLATALIGIFVVKRDGRDARTASPVRTPSLTAPPTRAQPRTAPAPGPTASAPRPSSTPSLPSVPPVVPGWSAVPSRELVAYDVPPEWKVESPGLLTGFETSGGAHEVVSMHNAATFKPSACTGAPTSYRARAGLVSPKGQRAESAAAEISRQWATVAGVHKDGSASPIGEMTVSPVKIAGGTLDATMATTTLTVTEPDSACPAPTMTFTAVSFVRDGALVVFMLYADQGVPDALPQDAATKVVGSLRPVGP